MPWLLPAVSELREELNHLGSLAGIPGAGWGPVPWMVSVLFLLGAGITAIQGQPRKETLQP